MKAPSKHPQQSPFAMTAARLFCAPLLMLVTGCWTSDAHDELADAGALNVSLQCDAVASNSCNFAATIPTSGEFLDLSVAKVDDVTTTSLQTRYACMTMPASFADIFGSSGLWVHSGKELEVGNTWGIDFLPESDTNPTCHLRGTVAGAYSWGIYMNPKDTCPYDGSTAVGVVDASAFDGLTITIGGSKPGPTGSTIISLFSLGTPEDPYREQKLAVTVPINPTMTTIRYHWNQMNAPCGHHEWFNPARIINMTGEMVMLAGVAYEYDVKFGKIGFFKD